MITNMIIMMEMEMCIFPIWHFYLYFGLDDYDLKVPHLPAGDYVLGWRWDCEESTQVKTMIMMMIVVILMMMMTFMVVMILFMTIIKQ